MSELNPNTSGSSQTTVPKLPDDRDDPLAHLHKMSTTAGLGSGDYVAISGAAVSAALVGLASTFSLLSPILLIIPVAGIVLAIVALWKIANSNGTQSGRGLAAMGLVLSLAFAGYVITTEVRAYLQTRAEQQAISDLVEQLEQCIRGAKWEEAHALHTDEFKSAHPLQVFTERWQSVQMHPFYGPVADLRWNGDKILFEKMPKDDTLAALAMVIMKFEKTQTEQGAEMYFRKRDDKWQIHSLPMFFPPPGSPVSADQ